MRILVTGASGQLGSYLLQELAQRNRDVVAWSHSTTGESFGIPLRPVDLSQDQQFRRAFADAQPDMVLHCGGMTSVADCYREPELAHQVNTRATETLSELCSQANARLLFTSTDLVFDGARGQYRENDMAAPLSIYGRTKLAAEASVLRCPRGVVVRLSLLYGPSLNRRFSFFDDQINALREGRPATLFVDEWRTPLDLKTAARALIELAESDCRGVIHLGGPERLSRFDMGRQLAVGIAVDSCCLVPALRSEISMKEPRPRDASLDSTLWRQHFPRIPWPTWQETMRALFRT